MSESISSVAEFERSLEQPSPPVELSELLRSLWYAAKGDWETAHQIAQEVADSNGSWVHAHLHREEGDLGNARYWYSHAGRPESTDSIQEERAKLVEYFLNNS